MKITSSRTMCLSACILFSLLVFTSCSEFHDKVFSNLLRLCPGKYVPTDNGTSLNQTSEFAGCCTDNFSHVSPTNSVLKKTKYATNGQRCLFPRTDVFKNRDQTERSYSMVTEPPKDGCLLPDIDTETIKGNNIKHPTCYDSDISPFSRFLPVYSKSSGFVYKNPNCASCHGQYDVTQWTTFAYCKFQTAFSFDLEECVFQFVYPGDHDDIAHWECFTDYFSACPADTTAYAEKFREETDLSVKEITDACSMDHLPGYTDDRFAKNVFCYICHYCEYSCSIPKRKCNYPTRNVPVRSLGGGFARILDSRLISQLHTDHDTVCEFDRNERVCHELLCPLGQMLTFDGQEKKCQMDSTKWTAQRFSILLLLEFENSIDVQENNLETILMQTESSWPKSWYIEILYQPFARNVNLVAAGEIYNVTNALPITSIKHVYVQLTYRHTTVNPVVLLRDIENILMESSFLNIDGNRHRARKSLGKSKLQTVKAVLSPGGGLQLISMPRWQLSADVETYNRWMYKPSIMNTGRKPAYFLNKLLLCKQVELPSANFQMKMVTLLYSKALTMLYYNRTGQYLYDNEFTKGSGRDGEQSFRLCVSDTRLKSNEGAMLQISLQPLLLATVIFNVL